MTITVSRRDRVTAGEGTAPGCVCANGAVPAAGCLCANGAIPGAAGCTCANGAIPGAGQRSLLQPPLS